MEELLGRIKKLSKSLEKWQKQILIDIINRCQEEKGFSPLYALIWLDFKSEITQDDLDSLQKLRDR